MKSKILNFMTLAAVWIITIICIGAFAKAAYKLAKMGWSLIP